MYVCVRVMASGGGDADGEVPAAAPTLMKENMRLRTNDNSTWPAT